MPIIACPNCRTSLEIRTVEPPSGNDSPIGTTELKAVHEFMGTMLPGRRTMAELYAGYELHREAGGWPRITKNSLARALRANGATPWRNSAGRGWDIPEIRRERAAQPRPSVREDEERRDYLETIQRHSMGTSTVHHDLPFEVEGL